jgi:hypothetical protein
VYRSALIGVGSLGVVALVVWLAASSSICHPATPEDSGGAAGQAVEPAAGSTKDEDRWASPPGLFHPDHPLGVTTGVGMIPPRLFKQFDLADWPAKAHGDAERLAATGAGWYRHHSSHFPGFDQQTLERREYDWTYHDELVRTVQAHGIDILLIIGRTNGIASCRQFTQHLPETYLPTAGEEEADYRHYVRTLVERYDADGVDDMPELQAPIRWFQLGNENDLHYETCVEIKRDYATPEQYLELVRITREEMREASADARLAASMTFGHVTENKSGWTERLLGLEDGAVLDDIDALDMHDYSRKLIIQRQRIDMLHTLSAGRVPIWITETSVPGDPEAAEGYDRDRQSRVLTALVGQGLASGKVQRVFWHALHDGPPVGKSRQWRVFGTNSLYGCEDPVTLPRQPPRCSGFALKPVGRAFALLSSALEGWTAVEPLADGAGYRVRRGDAGDALLLLPGVEPFDALEALDSERVRVWDLVENATDEPDEGTEVDAGEVARGEDPLLLMAAGG